MHSSVHRGGLPSFFCSEDSRPSRVGRHTCRSRVCHPSFGKEREMMIIFDKLSTEKRKKKINKNYFT